MSNKSLQPLITGLILLAPSSALADTFEGLFKDKDGAQVRVTKNENRSSYLLEKTISQKDGSLKRIKGQGTVVNGRLQGRFNTTNPKKSSFRARLQILENKEIIKDISLGSSFSLTPKQAQLRRILPPLKTAKEDQADTIVVPEEPNKIETPKIPPIYDPFKRPAPKHTISIASKRQRKNPRPPILPIALLLLALTPFRRRKKTQPRIRARHRLFKKALAKIRQQLTFVTNDNQLRNKLSFNKNTASSRLFARQKQLPEAKELRHFSRVVQRLANITEVRKLRNYAKDIARNLNKVADNIDVVNNTKKALAQENNAFTKEIQNNFNPLNPGNNELKRRVINSRSLEKQLGKDEAQLNKSLNRLSYLKNIPILGLLENQIFEKRNGQLYRINSSAFADDPRNRIVDLFDPTENFASQSISGQVIGYSKLAVYEILDLTNGSLSRADANLSDYNKGLINDRELTIREAKGTIGNVIKTAATAGLAAYKPFSQLKGVDKVVAELSLDLGINAGSIGVDAATGKGRDEYITLNDLKENVASTAINVALNTIGLANGIKGPKVGKVTKVATQAADGIDQVAFNPYREAANAVIQDKAAAVLGDKLVNSTNKSKNLDQFQPVKDNGRLP
jgi:hypothetical protein